MIIVTKICICGNPTNKFKVKIKKNQSNISTYKENLFYNLQMPIKFVNHKRGLNNPGLWDLIAILKQLWKRNAVKFFRRQ